MAQCEEHGLQCAGLAAAIHFGQAVMIQSPDFSDFERFRKRALLNAVYG